MAAPHEERRRTFLAGELKFCQVRQMDLGPTRLAPFERLIYRPPLPVTRPGFLTSRLMMNDAKASISQIGRE